MIELRINGLILLKQPLSLSDRHPLLAEQLPPGNWRLLAMQSGACNAVCTERITQIVSMLDQLKPAYRNKTQFTLITDEAGQLSALLNALGGEYIHLLQVSTAQLKAFNAAIHGIVNPVVANTKNLLALIIIDMAGNVKGYLIDPLDADKLLLTYSSVVEHR